MAVLTRVDRTAWLLLWHLREPARYRSEQLRDARPPDAEVVLRLALGRRVALADPALAQVGAATLRDAAAAYVRRQYFRPDATPYQTLGLPPFASDRAIKTSFRMLMQLVHPDRQQASPEWPDAFAAQANRAYAQLRDARARSRLDDEEKTRAARADGTACAASATARRPSPAASMARRRPPPPPALPEWLTAQVGGFVRAHPAVVAFGALIAVATALIVVAAWEGHDAGLTRDARDPAAPSTAGVPARGAEPVAVAAGAVDASPPAWAPSPPAAPPTVQTADRDVPPAPRPAAVVVPEQRELARLPVPTRPYITAAALPAPPRDQPASGATPLQQPHVSASPAGAPANAPADGDPRPAAGALPPAAAADAAAAPVPLAQVPPPAGVPAPSPAPTTHEIEVLFVALVDAYERGRAEPFAALFADDVQAGERRGRAAIRVEYDDLFGRSAWRRMRLTRVSWRPAGDVTQAQAEAVVRIGWRDGREVEQRIALDFEIARHDGRVVVTRMSQAVGAP